MRDWREKGIETIVTAIGNKGLSFMSAMGPR